jgi:hypothetical protein
LNMRLHARLLDWRWREDFIRQSVGCGHLLLDECTRYRPIFEVVLDYESGTSEQLANSSRAIGMNENSLPDL